MTVQNRETVGTIECKICGQVASLHQTARGKRRLLYKRCGCGCDQRTGEAIQKKWAAEMKPRKGFEYLKPEPEPEQEPAQEPEQEPAQEPEQEPEQNQQQKPAEKRGGSGLVPILGGVFGLGLLLITLGKSGGA